MGLEPAAASGIFEIFEGNIISAVQWLKLTVETVGAIMVAAGVLLAARDAVTIFLRSQPEDYNRVRLKLGRYLALALEFQLGADILSTAISPSWDQIGKLGAIAVIRTVLNYFLMREISAEQKKLSLPPPDSPQ